VRNRYMPGINNRRASKMQKPGSRILREEAKRKAVHVCGAAIPLLYLFLQKDLIIRGFVIGLCAVLIIEWSRLRGLVSLPFLRPGEEKNKEIGAYVFFVIGAFISVIVFEKSIAIAAILMLAIGDTVSALAGAVIIADKPGTYKKSLKPPEVMLSMFTTSLLIGWLVLLILSPAFSVFVARSTAQIYSEGRVTDT